jgi:hypothetical protein
MTNGLDCAAAGAVATEGWELVRAMRNVSVQQMDAQVQV